MFTLTIETTNAAFADDYRAEEIARILEGVAQRVEAGQLSGRILDTNGNGVGRFTLTAD